MAFNISFSGKNAIVTGAGRGIGKGVAIRLCELGANVVAVSQSAETLSALASECPSITTVQCNLGDWKETQEKLAPYTKNCDLLVNNAAISNALDIGEIQEEDLDRLFEVNYKGPVNVTQMVCEGMKERKSGSIVNVSSVSSFGAYDKHFIYGSTKVALDMLTKSCANEFGKFNVRTNSVNPTVVWTEMGRKFWSEESKNKMIRAKIPMDRFVEVNEVVDPVIFLLSDYASMINGAILPIDGGLSARADL